jgi:hypothetical protein
MVTYELRAVGTKKKKKAKKDGDGDISLSGMAFNAADKLAKSAGF